MSCNPLSPGISQTPNRLGCGPIRQNSNRVAAKLTIDGGAYPNDVDQDANNIGSASLQQNPNRIHAHLSVARDAYQIAKEQDPSIGTREEWIASLKGEPGETSIYDPIKTTLIGDGVTTVFTIGGAPSITNAAAVTVAVDGADQEPGVDYTVAGGLLTFTSPLEDGAKAVVISVSNIADTTGTTWHQLKDGWVTEPTLNMIIAEGEVWDYPHEVATYYRLIPEPYVSGEDTFYAAFSSGVLSGPIISRS